jgi:hypothetical protein
VQGRQGLGGEQGIQGPQGPAGKNGVPKAALYISTDYRAVDPGTRVLLAGAPCPEGTTLVGGGIRYAHAKDNYVTDAYPNGDAWKVVVDNESGSVGKIKVYSICLPLT